MRVGLYTRIAEDIAGEGLVSRARSRIADPWRCAEDGTVAGVYEDNDVSAFKTRVKRPEFEHLMEDLERGFLDGARGVRPRSIRTTARSTSSAPSASLTAAIWCSPPAVRHRPLHLRWRRWRESWSHSPTSPRWTHRGGVRRKHLELVQTGVPTGGWRPFGYLADRRTLDAREAQLIRQASSDVIAGVGLHTICRRWNDAVLSSRAAEWLRGLQARPRRPSAPGQLRRRRRA